LAQRGGRRRTQPLALFGQPDTPAGPLKEDDTEVFLEQADLATQRGLGDAEHRGRLGDRALLGDAQEVLEPVGIHTSSV